MLIETFFSYLKMYRRQLNKKWCVCCLLINLSIFYLKQKNFQNLLNSFLINIKHILFTHTPYFIRSEQSIEFREAHNNITKEKKLYLIIHVYEQNIDFF